jgi:hypothetical protein
MRRVWSLPIFAGLLGTALTLSAAEPWIAVVVPADAEPLTDANDVRKIFERKKIFDDQGDRLQPVNLPADSSLRRRFSRAVLRQSPEGMDDYWNQMYFQGVLPPHVIESEAGVMRFVAQTPHAIGYIAACSVDATVRVVMLIDPDGRVQPAGANPGCPGP